MCGKGLAAWDIGEEFETKKRQLSKTLTRARKELTERLQLTEELRKGLAILTEEALDTETKEEAIEFLVNLPNIERINELNRLMSEAHQAEVEKQLQQGVIRSEDFNKDFKYGSENIQETKDSPGATSSKDRPRVNVIRVKMIKVREEDSSEEFEIAQTD